MRQTMSRIIPLVTIILLTLFMGCKENVKIETLVPKNGVFYRNDTLFKIAAAELPYSRIPYEYWASRIELLKRMGVNTLSVRIPWMLHEQKEGIYNFEGSNDIRTLCRMAQEQRLLVWLHIGPATDEFMDMAGMPWWLLKDNDIDFTANNKNLMIKVGSFYRALGSQLSDMQLSNGGPIALIQVGEPVGVFPNDKKTLLQLQDSAVAAGFSNSIFTVASSGKHVQEVNVPKSVIAVNVETQEHAMSNFTSVKKIQSSMPILCYDIDRRCMDIWGAKEPVREWHKIYMRMYEVFSSVGSVNISSVCGGTSFGHIAGAIETGNRYYPYSTSFMSDAIINECGFVNKHYSTFGKAIRHFVADDNFTQEGLSGVAMFSLPDTEVCDVAPLFDNISSYETSTHPLTMERCNVGYGAVLYESILPQLQDGDRLLVKGVHDNAQVFLNGKPVVAINRNDNNEFVLLSSANSYATLHILVDAMGRVGNILGYKDYKGLTDVVELYRTNGMVDTLTNWKNYPLPAEYNVVNNKKFERVKGATVPGYYKTFISKPGEGDFYLDMHSWSRGEAWINGHSLGRFCNNGTKRTLYVPGCWLHDGDNELLIVDWVGPVSPVVAGRKGK